MSVVTGIVGGMDAKTGSLVRRMLSVAEECVAALSPRGAVSDASDAELLEAAAAAFAVGDRVEAILARLAGEVSERSRTGLGAERLARRFGESSAPALLAVTGRTSRARAARLTRVGEATRARTTLTAEPLPPVREDVAEALLDGALTVEAADTICGSLAQVTGNPDPADTAAAERALVEFAADAPVDTVRTLATRWRDALGPDGVEPREESLVRRRSLTRTVRVNGMVRYTLDADPVSAGHLDAVLDARVADAFRGPRFAASVADPADGGARAETAADVADPRTLAQIRADALVELARHGLECTGAPGSTPSATVVVRMDLATLVEGVGQARIDGLDQPISAGTARRLAADAELIPMVLGGRSEVLDLGTSRRLFSRAQRLALAERDGGCAWPHCPRPPGHAEAHHLRWWARDGGATDLGNGILLCSVHHHRVHSGGWEVRVRDGVPWFIPPPDVDIYRRPRRGGRLPEPQAAA